MQVKSDERLCIDYMLKYAEILYFGLKFVILGNG